MHVHILSMMVVHNIHKIRLGYKMLKFNIKDFSWYLHTTVNILSKQFLKLTEGYHHVNDVQKTAFNFENIFLLEKS
jgi:hypothetical protein